jgi:hypothetical protein
MNKGKIKSVTLKSYLIGPTPMVRTHLGCVPTTELDNRIGTTGWNNGMGQLDEGNPKLK